MIRILLLTLASFTTLLFSEAHAQDSATQWTTVDIPSDWTRPRNGASENGFRWYRCIVKLPSDWDGKELSLYVEPVDDAREVYLNGVKVAALGAMPPKFRSDSGKTRSIRWLPTTSWQERIMF